MLGIIGSIIAIIIGAVLYYFGKGGITGEGISSKIMYIVGVILLVIGVILFIYNIVMLVL